MLFHHSTLCYGAAVSHTDRHRSTTDRHRSPHETPTKHCTPLALALKLVPSGCRYSMQLHCTKGAELMSQFLAPPRTVKVVAFSASHREDGQCTADSSTMCLPHVLSHLCLSQSGVRVAMALPRDGNVAPPRWLLPTLPYSPPHANRRGVQLQCGNMEQQRGTP